jgi:hypothetical protein
MSLSGFLYRRIFRHPATLLDLDGYLSVDHGEAP